MKAFAHSVLVLSLGMLLTAGLTGCRGGSDSDINNDPGSASTASGHEPSTHIEELPGFDQDTLFEPARGLQTIYFAFDSYELQATARGILGDNAEKIRRVPGVIIQIEGHCDERGTQEYNLALGERRALAARSYLIKLGVSGDRIITISYGEEDPADPGHSEAAWSQNRRCKFNRAL